MEVAGVVLAVLPLLDSCVTVTRRLTTRFSFISSEPGSGRQGIWQAFEARRVLRDIFLDVVSRHHRDLSRDAVRNIVVVLRQLETLLLEADDILERYSIKEPASNMRQRLAFVASGADKLERILKDMEGWERTMHVHLTVILLEAKLDPGTSAGQAVSFLPQVPWVAMDTHYLDDRDRFLPPAGLDNHRYDVVPHSSGSIFYARDDAELVERKPYLNEGNTRNILALVATLRRADPRQMHILSCKGAVNRGDQGVDIRFDVLPDYQCQEPRTLRALLLDERRARHPLNHRLRIVQNLADAILYVHSARFVHKNVRPEAVLVLTSDGDAARPGYRGPFPRSLGEAFLAGFETLRGLDEPSAAASDFLPERKVYRHPSRWDLFPDQRFSILHDIYSLGVIMLEVGSWTSLCKGESGVVFHSMIREQMSRPTGHDAQKRFIEIATKDLPVCMGTTYAEITVDCLKAVEERLGRADEDESGGNSEHLGTVLTDRVISRLRSINL
ncbi:hypothetical protein EDB81DRAFT_933860 [Dactylonectria macrodidyma]|uniref:Protein kinase domain-containing protein n=1 Tax=Dactylonectria macrodidyma TaxID=307937 RepID=A0A9P9EUY3_9HYPO|nr:hypothetical protein EDB81DRAFT_933860 [Dactylonectria macrodidyma]